MKDKERYLFLQNAGSKDLNRYFYLLQKLATKNNKYNIILQKDFGYLKQNGGFLSGKSNKCRAGFSGISDSISNGSGFKGGFLSGKSKWTDLGQT